MLIINSLVQGDIIFIISYPYMYSITKDVWYEYKRLYHS
jgi:hypothetical protein